MRCAGYTERRVPGSTVGIATELRAGRSGIESRWGRDFPPVQTGPGAQPPVKWVPGLSPGVKCGRGVLLTTHPLLVRGHGRVELYLYPPSGPHRACNGITLPLYIYIYVCVCVCVCVCVWCGVCVCGLCLCVWCGVVCGVCVSVCVCGVCFVCVLCVCVWCVCVVCVCVCVCLPSKPSDSRLQNNYNTDI